MKFIHAGDLHLGNAFEGLSDIPEWLMTKLQNATSDAFTNLVDQAIAEQVDFIVLPGDIYNTTQINPRIQLFFSQQMERLNEAKIPVILGYGNHDFVEDFASQGAFPENVTVLSHAVETVHLTTKEQVRVAISGFSYPTRHLNRSMVADFPVKGDEDYHIGMYHGAIGVDGEGDYAPFNLNALNAKHYQYWALGHIHVRQTLQEHPFIGYSGSLQGLNHKEAGEKGYYLVESNADGELIPHFVASAPIIWSQQTVEMLGNRSFGQAVTELRNAVDSQVEQFALLALNVTVDQPETAQILNAHQVQEQLALEATSADHFYIYQVKATMEQPVSVLPELPAENWKAGLKDLVTFDELQKIGLNLVHNPEIFAYFSDNQTLAELQTQVEELVEKIQGGMLDVD